MRKDGALALLIGVNMLLAGALLISSAAPQQALAQPSGTGLSGNYVVVTGEVRDQFDALYVLSLRNRILHSFTFDRATKRLEYADSRDLERDIRNNRGQP